MDISVSHHSHSIEVNDNKTSTHYIFILDKLLDDEEGNDEMRTGLYSKGLIYVR